MKALMIQVNRNRIQEQEKAKKEELNEKLQAEKLRLQEIMKQKNLVYQEKQHIRVKLLQEREQINENFLKYRNKLNENLSSLNKSFDLSSQFKEKQKGLAYVTFCKDDADSGNFTPFRTSYGYQSLPNSNLQHFSSKQFLFKYEKLLEQKIQALIESCADVETQI